MDQQTQMVTPPSPPAMQSPAPDMTVQMSQCPKCHVDVRLSDYFCFNCGQALRTKPESVSLVKQMTVYLLSFLLPPLGIIWGIRYLRQDGSNSKIVGTVAIVLTLISLAVTLVFTINLANTVNQQIESQMNALMAL